jgi:trimethylamine--corrinoid protein Co-methyltransferase
MFDFFIDQKRNAVCGLNLLSENAYKDIHLATLQVLEQTGVFVEDPHALEVFGCFGAQVDKNNKMVKLPSRIVEDAIQSAPA